MSSAVRLQNQRPIEIFFASRITSISHSYFQAPGGQCFKLVAMDEDLSIYEGAGVGPEVAKVKEALNFGERSHELRH